MKEKILILGNGFNNALGLNVGYEDFFQSAEWIKISEWINAPIIKYIREYKTQNTNIEDLLRDYIHSGWVQLYNCAECDKAAFSILENEFAVFVNKELQRKINKINNDTKVREEFVNTKAFRTISEFQKQINYFTNDEAVAIYSFCYTNFDYIRKNNTPPVMPDVSNFEEGKEIGNQWGPFLNIDYMHGVSSNTANSYAIFGLSKSSFEGCSDEICEKYKFLLKESHDKYFIYGKDYLKKSLQNAECIEFYGFGFTEPDNPYFEDWLMTDPSFDGEREIILHILGKDQDGIIETLRKIAGENWESFLSHYSIKFIFPDMSEKIYPEQEF